MTSYMTSNTKLYQVIPSSQDNHHTSPPKLEARKLRASLSSMSIVVCTRVSQSFRTPGWRGVLFLFNVALILFLCC